MLVTVDPSTGDTVQLLPALTNVLDIRVAAENAEPQSLIMPAYSPARHALAYIGVDTNGTRSLWMTSLEVTSVGLTACGLGWSHFRASRLRRSLQYLDLVTKWSMAHLRGSVGPHGH